MTTYTATIVDLFWRESSIRDIAATTEQEAIDEAFEYTELLGLLLSEINGDDGTHISFDLPTDIPVHDVEVLIDNEGTALETEVPSCTIDGVQSLVELLWGPDALLAVRFGNKHMNFNNRRIIALNAPKSWHFPIHYLM
ncbi:MAG: hypothetical protein WCK23_07790 [Actinomycetes bacterium]